MKHYIISKFKPEYKEKLNEFIPDIRKIFLQALQLERVSNVHFYLNCVNRPNRYDLMIVIEMEKEALEEYDKSDFHKQWKEKYGPMLESKAIFDSEDSD